MKYKDGQTVRAGDVVQIDDLYRGVVVAAIEDKSYLPGYEEREWDYLESGALIDTNFAGLVHYPHDDEQLVLLSRGNEASE
ncbi:hypothetical protein [Dyella subtropica]|uniref:hypothetical protein n=1 Tax=Dyella subtropica TaxID=2992127 RepID=UPI00225220F6|nr:hypothetical protein [Dyella subtropica]